MIRPLTGCVVLGLIIFIVVASFFSIHIAAIAYVVGVLARAIVFIIGQRGNTKEAYLDRLASTVTDEIVREKSGRLLYYISSFVGRLISILNWPVDIVRGLYLYLLGGLRVANFRSLLLGQTLVPGWVGPPLLTLIALFLLDHEPLGFATVGLLIVFIASSLLILISTVFFSDIKDAVLRGPGSVKLTFVLIFLINFAGAAYARLSLERTFEGTQETVFESAYSIFSFADIRNIGEKYGVSLAHLSTRPQDLFAFVDVPTHLLLQALIGILFYLGFVRISFDIFSARREPKHFINLGIAHAVCGNLERAEAMLAKGVPEREAYQNLLTVRFAMGAYRDLTKAAQRLFGIIGVNYTPEEEAVITLIQTAGMLGLDTDKFAGYLNYRAKDFSEEHTTALIAVLFGPSLSDPKAFRELPRVSQLAEDRFFRVHVRDYNRETDAVRAELANLNGSSFTAIFLRMMIGLSSLLDDDLSNEPDEATVTRLEDDIRALAEDDKWHEVHWKLWLGYQAVIAARLLYCERFGRSHDTLDAIVRKLRPLLRESEFLRDAVFVMAKIQDREIGAAIRAHALKKADVSSDMTA